MSVITCRSNVLRGVRELAKKRPTEALYNYLGGKTGSWEVTTVTAHHGWPLAHVSHLDIVNGPLERLPAGTTWVLSGLVRRTRHVTREDFDSRSVSPISGGTQTTCAALIPIRKSSAWWALDQMERREILQTRSWSSSLGQQFFSAIARRLPHGCNVSEQFDDVTWFEYAPRDEAAFEDLLAAWRVSEEWSYVERDCDLRMVRAA